MSKNLLDDDFDWDNVNDAFDENMDSEKRQPVFMLRTFNTEEQAYLAAATLHAEGIEAHVVTATTGQLTPFAYGNVRLFVAQSQKEMAENILKDFGVRQDIYNEPHLSIGRILVILVAGIFIMGLILRLGQLLFRYF